MGCTVYTGSAEATEGLAFKLGEMLVRGSFVCLRGELGAGKTTFVRGLARGLGVTDEYITSPSFALINEYSGRQTFYHADLYRLSGPDELYETGFLELPGEGVAAVEWPERADGHLPADRLEIYIEYSGDTERKLTFSAHGAGYDGIMEEICRRPRL